MTCNLHDPKYHSSDLLSLTTSESVSVRFAEAGHSVVSMLFENHVAALHELTAALEAVRAIAPRCKGLDGECYYLDGHEGRCNSAPF